MTSIIKVDTLQKANGATPTAADLGINTTGSVLQVVNGTITGNVGITTSSRVDVLSLSITPKFSSSKILVAVNLSDVGQNNVSSSYGRFTLLRNTTDLIRIGGQIGYTGNTASNSVASCSTSYLDSPSTTSSVTYKIQGQSVTNSGTIEVGASSSISTITLMEIAG